MGSICIAGSSDKSEGFSMRSPKDDTGGGISTGGGMGCGCDAGGELDCDGLITTGGVTEGTGCTVTDRSPNDVLGDSGGLESAGGVF